MKHALRIVALTLTLCLPSAGPVAADQLDDAAAAYDSGDYATALKLLRPSADQGVALAQYNLGLMYANGQGVPQDYAAAVKWFRMAADQGVAVAQYNLGLMYFNHQGVPQDYAAALKWFRKAADQRVALAQYNLGVMYYNGLGVPQDYVRAHMWLNLAAVGGDNNAIKNRDLVAALMTPEQIAEAQKLAREWKPKPAAQ